MVYQGVKRLYQKKIKAILFDLDGVLVSSQDWHYEALNKALRLYGYEISRDEHISLYNGLPTIVKLKKLSAVCGLQESLYENICDMKQNYFYETVSYNCRMSLTHKFAFKKLKEDGYKIAVCSNAIRNTVLMILDKLDLLRYVDLVLSNEDVLNCKPAPDIYVKAMGLFGCAPFECLILEDSDKGVKAALDSEGFVLRVNNIYDVNYINLVKNIYRIDIGIY